MTARFILLLLLSLPFGLKAQTLPANRACDWTQAGWRYQAPSGRLLLLSDYGGLPDDGMFDNVAFNAALADMQAGDTLLFRAGVYGFNQSLVLPDSVVIQGAGADSTILRFNLGGVAASCFLVQGQQSPDTAQLMAQPLRGARSLQAASASRFAPGDFVQLISNDSALMTSTWAMGTSGQICRVDSVVGDRVYLDEALRREHPLLVNGFSTHLRKLNLRQGVQIRCLTIERQDQTAAQTHNIAFNLAANCRVEGLRSLFCNYAHVDIRRSTRIEVKQSYFNQGFDYGEGGKAYGVMVQGGSGDCRIEDCIFERLRHSMILQSGANGNVFAYNFSTDPFWVQTGFPSNSTGDMVLHGNYVYLNLFEGNWGQNIVVDNSHGPNGPYNTFLRNRAGLFGIFFSANNSPLQNFLGNDISSTALLQGQYTLQGSGHFEHANLVRGSIRPSGTNSLPDSSYAYAQRPSFLPLSQWAAIGLPAQRLQGTNPARERFVTGDLFSSCCGRSPRAALAFDTSAILVTETDTVILLALPIRQIRGNAAETWVYVEPRSNGLPGDAAQTSLDYRLLSDSLGFAPNEDVVHYLGLEILPDSLVENTEYIRFALAAWRNTLGAELEADSLLLLSILDRPLSSLLNQAQTSPKIYPNPLPLGAQAWVELAEAQHYQVFEASGRFLAQGFMPASGYLPFWPKTAGLYIIRWENGQTSLLLGRD